MSFFKYHCTTYSPTPLFESLIPSFLFIPSFQVIFYPHIAIVVLTK